jgi:acetyl-CoA/propionyl-CoA carboxylase biotin carboxyl carrier protein
VQRDVDVEVDGRRFKVKLWVPDVGPAVISGGAGTGGRAGAPAGRSRPRPGAAAGAGGAAGSGNVMVPMQGTIVKVLVKEGDTVEVGQAICILEAMKMENNVLAEKAGTIKEIRVQPGQAVGAGDTVAVIE